MDDRRTAVTSPAVTYSLGRLARAFFEAGSQSVGGGASTILLTRFRLVDRLGWMTHREFMEEWALSRFNIGTGSACRNLIL